MKSLLGTQYKVLQGLCARQPAALVMVYGRGILKSGQVETRTVFLPALPVPIGRPTAVIAEVDESMPPPPLSRSTYVSHLAGRQVSESVSQSVSQSVSCRKMEFRFPCGGGASDEIPLTRNHGRGRSLARPLPVGRAVVVGWTPGRTDIAERERERGARTSERQSHCAHSRRRFAIRLPLF